ncbi:unnamed protein product, partial [Laminaria digitata]
DTECPLESTPINGTHRCPGCDGLMYAFCREGVGDEGYGQKRICGSCAGSGVANAVSVD